MNRYNFKQVEEKWQSYWLKKNAFKSKIDPNKKKFYCLEMFPYPSGKIHMGHVRNYTIGDVLSRHKLLQNFNVLHPMGWDSFGMPAENAARENNLSPKEWTEKNINVMKNQLKKLGLSIDWDREISTCSEDYYKHQQLFFLEMYNKGLIYRKENYVNWDPIDETVLANEQVIDGKGWRSGAVVQRKKLNQWFFNISKFSDVLLDELDNLNKWPNKVKIMQKNWIGKSFGCEIDFKIEGSEDFETIKCFTTRPDTLFGISFLALSIDHPVSKLYENDKDFKNLLNVYTDAAFFPNLNRLDFYQEGHRLEFDENNELKIKGVVFNEMKGAMSSASAQLWHGMTKHLYPDTTYQFNSGGNPKDIINLTHEDLVNFHQSHYHPSNANFFTFGNIDLEEVQGFIQENVCLLYTSPSPRDRTRSRMPSSA